MMRFGSHVLSLSLDGVYRRTERVRETATGFVALSESSSENLCQLIGLEQNGIRLDTACPLRFFDQLLNMFVPDPKLA